MYRNSTCSVRHAIALITLQKPSCGSARLTGQSRRINEAPCAEKDNFVFFFSYNGGWAMGKKKDEGELGEGASNLVSKAIIDATLNKYAILANAKRMPTMVSARTSLSGGIVGIWSALPRQSLCVCFPDIQLSFFIYRTQLYNQALMRWLWGGKISSRKTPRDGIVT